MTWILGEHIGRGMRRIMQYLNKENFEISDNFVVINLNFDEEALMYLNVNGTNESLSLKTKVYNLIKENSNITIQQIVDAVNMSKKTINNIISSLKEKIGGKS